MRKAFLDTLFQIAAKDSDVYLVVGDLGYSVVEEFAAKRPNQFLNAGIAEQNMMGVAAGLALSGKKVCVYSIANFPTLRCLEQIRNDVCYHNADVKIISVGAGLAYASLGASHQATEDISVMRALPNMIVVSPADPLETKYATEQILAHNGPCYLRLGKAGESVIHKGDIKFEIGKALTVKEGRDITIISTGAILKSCVEAAERLEKLGKSVRLVSMHTIKPVDVDAIKKAAHETGAILTVEEHNLSGGLGSAVAEVFAGIYDSKARFASVGLNDAFSKKVGSQNYLRDANGLSVDDIVAAAEKLFK